MEPVVQPLIPLFSFPFSLNNPEYPLQYQFLLEVCSNLFWPVFVNEKSNISAEQDG